MQYKHNRLSFLLLLCKFMLILLKREMQDLKKESDILLAIPPHEHIVQIIGICIDSRHFGIILEYVDDDLSNLLSSHTSDPYMDEWRNKLDMTCQIADGMKHLHGLHPQIIHRDLKPNNILVKTFLPRYTCKARNIIFKISILERSGFICVMYILKTYI